MQLGQIKAFLAVREAGSLRAAARRIGISQPGISKALASLEADLQAELFVRTSRGVRLTEAGRLFGARAAVVQSELAANGPMIPSRQLALHRAIRWFCGQIRRRAPSRPLVRDFPLQACSR